MYGGSAKVDATVGSEATLRVELSRRCRLATVAFVVVVPFEVVPPVVVSKRKKAMTRMDWPTFPVSHHFTVFRSFVR